MLRFLATLAGTTALALIFVGARATADNADRRHTFKLSLDSRVDLETSGQKQKMETETAFQYAWQRKGNERTLTFDSMLVKVRQDGKETMNSTMSRAKVTGTENGKTTETPLEKAPEGLRAMLQDSFDVPVCKIQVDENFREVKRTVVAGPGAKDFIDQGMIANALLLHPPFLRDQEKWTAPAEVSMGNGGFAKGELTYKKAVGGKGGQLVKVTGTLTNDNFNPPGTPLTIRKARYVVNGEQTFDPALREWVSGKLLMDVSFEMAAGDKVAATFKGILAVGLEKLPDKK